MRKAALTVSMVLTALAAGARGQGPVAVHPANPHYFTYQGKPLLLLTSDHTYFAVTAPDFDYVKFLDTLAAHRNNFTRIYPGAHPVNYTNQPRLFPWKKLPSGKYDLDAWDSDYFKRLHGFMQYARSKSVIVDIVPFNGFGSEARKSYQWRWEWAPLNAANNLQGVGTKREHLFTLDEPALVKYEKAYLRKLATELNRYDNLLYDLSDEPDLFNTLDDAKVNPWVGEMMDELIAAEKALPKKHLIAQTYYRSLEDHGKEWGADPRTTWISIEYNGGISAFDRQYAYGKPYVLIETVSPVLNPLGFWKETYGVDASRVHSWAFLLGGGAGFMEFNDDYDSQAPEGREETQTILHQKKLLMDFMDGLDLVRMRRYRDFEGVAKDPGREDSAATAWASAIAEPGKQYALYISRSRVRTVPHGPGYYEVAPGAWQDSLALNNVPAGRYQVDWVNPADLAVVRSATLEHPGGSLRLPGPKYAIDLVLRIKAAGR